MEDFWRPVIQDEYSVVRQPSIEVNNFETQASLDHNGTIAPIYWAS